MVADKSMVTQNLMESLQKHSTKIAFIPDNEIIEAIRQLEEKGLPNNKHEDYKYCNIEAVIRKEFKELGQLFDDVSTNEINTYKLDGTLNLVVLNGNFNPELSDKIISNKFIVKSLKEITDNEKSLIATQANSKTDSLIALNTMFSSNGFFLRTEKKTLITTPVHVIYITNNTTPSLSNSRNFIQVDDGSELTLIESFVHIGIKKHFFNYVSEKLVAQNSKLTCYTFQNEGKLSYSVHTNQVKLNKNARYSNSTFTLSGELVRNNHNIELAASNCEAHLNGLFITNGTQLVDNHTLIDHQMPHCESNELYKGIANGKSTGVFNGKIFVRKDAQKTNAYQSSKNILMSDEATINTKPQLEIYADDVKCSHGTSTGKIDIDALFYLKTRGISEENARKLLLHAFAHELIDKIEIDPLKEKIVNLFERAL